MAKFTVYFKDKAIYSEIFDSGVVHIGRDETNDLTIDSLSVAPAHAAVIIKINDSLIKQLNEEYPLIVNDMPAKEAVLKNNDRISIGKHAIVYNITESISSSAHPKPDKDIDFLNGKLEENFKPSEANLQVMNGPHIGRILTLKKTMTRIGNSKTGVVIISRRKEGYFVSALEDCEKEMAVNKAPIGEKSIQLNNNDIISIHNISMQFFQANL